MSTQSDRVYLALNAAETSETKIGTMTVPIGAQRIVAVYGKIQQPTGTNGEMVSGSFRIQPKSSGGNFSFDAQAVDGQGAVGAINSVAVQYIPVDIPVKEKDTIDAFVTGDIALTGTCTGVVGVIYG